MRYAMIVNSRVVDIVVSETLPNYPKTPDGKQVIAVKCGEEVKIGMYYNAVDNTFSIEFPEPEPTMNEKIYEAVSKSQDEVRQEGADMVMEELVKRGLIV